MTFPFGIGVTTVPELFWTLVAGALWHAFLIFMVFWHWDEGETKRGIGETDDGEWKYDA